LAISCWATAIPAAGQSSGILLGVRLKGVEEDGSASRYQTLWIVRSQDRPLRATLPDLVVPRNSGFWRVGVAGTCSDSSGPGGWRIDRIWKVRATVRPAVEAGCPITDASVLAWRGVVRDSGDQADTTGVVCAVETTEILFVTGEHIGARRTSSQTEDCEPRGSRYEVTPSVAKWGRDSAISLGQIVGAGTDSAFARAALAATLSASEECQFLVTEGSRESTAESMDDWFVARDRGRWRAFAYDHVYGSECDFESGIDLVLPSSFTGHDSLRPSWRAITLSVPAATDAFASPSGELVIVILPDSLLAFESDGVRLGQRLLAIALSHERVVMAQWATGKHVGRWDREIAVLRPSLRPARISSPYR
jgi:hypothetical protein